MADVKLIVRTADQTRKAEIEVARASTGADVIQAAVDNWKLPADTDYALVNITSGKAIAPADPLSDATAKDGDVLEVQPVLVAG
jgi:hypothetical protein